MAFIPCSPQTPFQLFSEKVIQTEGITVESVLEYQLVLRAPRSISGVIAQDAMQFCERVLISLDMEAPKEFVYIACIYF